MTDWQLTLFKSIGMARISKIIPQVPDVTASPVKGALLEVMLPSLHYLAIFSTLDEALFVYIDTQNIPWPPNTKRDFFNRINIAAEAVPSIDSVSLHEIRKQRNLIAHEPDSVFSNPLTWAQLDHAIDCVGQIMKELGFIREIPNIEAFFDRTPELFPDELGPNGERVRHNFTVGAKLNDKVFISFSHDVAYFPPSP